jgi:hypothetical protein
MCWSRRLDRNGAWIWWRPAEWSFAFGRLGAWRAVRLISRWRSTADQDLALHPFHGGRQVRGEIQDLGAQRI